MTSAITAGSVRSPLAGKSGHSWLPWFLLFLLAGMLSVAVPTLIALQPADALRSEAWVPALLLACWAGLRLSYIIAVGEPRLFNFFFWLFTYVFMGVAPAVQIIGGQPSSTTPAISRLADDAMIWTVILGVVMFELGGIIARVGRPSWTDVVDAGRQSTLRADPRPLRAIQSGSAVILTIAGLLLAAFYVQQVGLAALFTDRETAGLARTAAIPDSSLRAIVTSLATYPTLIGVGALLHVRGRCDDFRARTWYLVLALAGIAVLVVVVNPISSARYTLGTVLFALAVMCGAMATRARVRISLIAIILGLFFVFPIADAFRRPDEVNINRVGFLDEYLANPDYDAIWQISNALAYWSSGMADVGRQALGLPLFWVPRSLWPGKPPDTGTLLADFRGYEVSNLSAPLWAEALVNGGLVALVVVFVLLGYALQLLDERTARGLGSSGWLLVGAVLPVYQLILLRGSLLQATGSIAVMIASILFVYRRPRSSSSIPPTTAP